MNLTLTHNPNENALHFLMTKTPIDPRESVDPLERIRAEHFRQRSLCNLLIRLADDPFRRGGRQIARVARDYLAGPLVFHVTDEIDDLLPLLDARCGASDEIDRVHSILIENHLADIALADEVINEIEVKDKSSLTDSAQDIWIATQLKAKILIDSEVSSINYSIETVNGIVYLIGIAQNQAELDRVTNHARNIRYVEKVVSYVRLPKAPQG